MAHAEAAHHLWWSALLAGASGSGKSSLLYGLAEAVSNGSDFMGQLATKKGKVCFIQSDESPENAADKLKVMGITQELRCAERHAYRVLKGLYIEDKITRQTLASTGGRPRYAYAEKPFCTSPTPPSSDIALDPVSIAKQIETNIGCFGLERQ